MDELYKNVQKLNILKMYEFCVIVMQGFKGCGGFECKRARVSVSVRNCSCGGRFWS